MALSWPTTPLPAGSQHGTLAVACWSRPRIGASDAALTSFGQQGRALLTLDRAAAGVQAVNAGLIGAVAGADPDCLTPQPAKRSRCCRRLHQRRYPLLELERNPLVAWGQARRPRRAKDQMRKGRPRPRGGPLSRSRTGLYRAPRVLTTWIETPGLRAPQATRSAGRTPERWAPSGERPSGDGAFREPRSTRGDTASGLRPSTPRNHRDGLWRRARGPARIRGDRSSSWSTSPGAQTRGPRCKLAGGRSGGGFGGASSGRA